MGLVSLDPANDRGMPDGRLLADDEVLQSDRGPPILDDGELDLEVGWDCETPGLDLEDRTVLSGLICTWFAALLLLTGDFFARGKLAVPEDILARVI